MILLYILLTAFIFIIISFVFLTVGRVKRPKCPAFYGGLYAHRGLHDKGDPRSAPENSLEAFRRAVAHGYGVELDVHFSRDGECVVFHDGNLKRMTDVDKKLEELTAEEITALPLLGGDERVPLFSEVLGVIDGKIPMVVELKCDPRVKCDPLCEKVMQYLDAYAEKTHGQFSVESFNPYVVKWFKRRRPDIFRGQLTEAFYKRGKRTLINFMMENLALNVLGRPDFAAYNHLDRKNTAFRIWKNIYRAPIAFWTVKSESDLVTLIKETDGASAYIFEGFTPENDIIEKYSK